MLCIPVKEFLFWKKKQLSKGGDQQSFAFLLDCVGGISSCDLNSLGINPEANLYLKKKLRILRIYLGKSFSKFCPYPIPLWDCFLEEFKIKSY